MASERFAILLIEDNAGDARLIREALAAAEGATFDLEWKDRVHNGLERLAHGGIDAVLLDLSLPDGHGIEVFNRVHGQAKHLPVILLTGTLQDEEQAIVAVQKGAQDYLIKGKVESGGLVRALRYAIERKRGEQALRESEERFRRLSDATFETIAITEQGRILDVNQTFATMFGFRPAEAIGRFAWEFAAPESRELVQEMITTNTEGPYEAVALRKDGTKFIVEVRGRLMPYEGRMVRMAAIRDITERKRLEQMKDEFISMISHELRTPLSIVISGLHNLQAMVLGPLTPRQAETAQMIARTVHRFARMVDQLLDLSRLELRKTPVHRERLDTAQVVAGAAQAMQSAAQARRVEVTQDLQRRVPAIHVDPDMFEQVLTNLLTNAIRFAKSKVTVRAHGSAAGSFVQLSVADDGPGIPTGELGRLFTKFTQLHRPESGEEYKGTGLGLAICKEIVELHGGRIWVESTPGVGSHFHFTIPRFREDSV